MRQYFCCCGEYYYISSGGYQYVPVPEEGTERMESGSSKWCPVAGPEASGHTLKHRRFPLKSGNAFYCVIK